MPEAARSCALLHTIGVGRHPISLAVDEATARLFVVNTNAGCVRAPGVWQYVPSFARRLLPFLPGPPKPTCNMPVTVSVIDTSARYAGPGSLAHPDGGLRKIAGEGRWGRCS